jgi:hypothetical protein
MLLPKLYFLRRLRRVAEHCRWDHPYSRNQVLMCALQVYEEVDPVYDSDDTDAQEPANTIGDIPLSFYDSYPHIGYDINGKRIMRPAKGEALDALLDQIEIPRGWTGLTDPATGKPLNLSQDELELLRRVQMNEVPEEGYDPYPVSIKQCYKVIRTSLTNGTGLCRLVRTQQHLLRSRFCSGLRPNRTLLTWLVLLLTLLFVGSPTPRSRCHSARRQNRNGGSSHQNTRQSE